tara:strand:- start:84 stop:578 length:495 start_codon:yes stop_codon:yes gene_type:complete
MMATQYKIYGTDKLYTGRTVEFGGFLYSTEGGAYEGNSVQLVGTSTDVPVDNPVTRTFVSRVLYFRQDGTPVPRGTNLHQHADGTIMLGHDPNNMGAIVTRQNPNAGNQNPNQQQQNQLMGGTELTSNTNVNGTGTNNNQVGGSPSNQNQPSPQSGGMGGGGSY